jgi:ATP-dependent DNA helicase RecG
MELDPNQYFHRDESLELEYKEGYNKDDLAETIAAFSTTKGGLILIGVKDDGTPIGFDKPIKFEEHLQDVAKNIDGIASILIECFPYPPNKYIVAIKVGEGEKKPYGWKGVFYQRKGKNDYKLNASEIFQIKLQSLNLTFDSLNCKILGRDATINDLDERRITDYIEMANQSRRQRSIQYFGPKHTLHNLNLLAENGYQPKNAALFLFGKNLQDSFPYARINFLVYKGDVIDEDYRERQFIGGTLTEQLNAAFRLFLQFTERKIVIQEMKRIEITQYPTIAIREALTNAVAHRDYTIADSEIVFRIFKNRIELSNPGGLLEGVNLDELRKGGHHSRRRNPIVCRLFDDIGFMEQSGQGITNMRTKMEELGLKPPAIDADSSRFKISFEGLKIDGDIAKSPTASVYDLQKILNKRQRVALVHIQGLPTNEGITATEYKEKYKVSMLTAMTDLRLLQRIGAIKGEKNGRSRVFNKI